MFLFHHNYHNNNYMAIAVVVTNNQGQRLTPLQSISSKIRLLLLRAIYLVIITKAVDPFIGSIRGTHKYICSILNNKFEDLFIKFLSYLLYAIISDAY